MWVVAPQNVIHQISLIRRARPFIIYLDCLLCSATNILCLDYCWSLCCSNRVVSVRAVCVYVCVAVPSTFVCRSICGGISSDCTPLHQWGQFLRAWQVVLTFVPLPSKQERYFNDEAKIVCREHRYY